MVLVLLVVLIDCRLIFLARSSIVDVHLLFTISLLLLLLLLSRWQGCCKRMANNSSKHWISSKHEINFSNFSLANQTLFRTPNLETHNTIGDLFTTKLVDLGLLVVAVEGVVLVVFVCPSIAPSCLQIALELILKERKKSFRVEMKFAKLIQFDGFVKCAPLNPVLAVICKTDAVTKRHQWSLR